MTLDYDSALSEELILGSLFVSPKISLDKCRTLVQKLIQVQILLLSLLLSIDFPLGLLPLLEYLDLFTRHPIFFQIIFEFSVRRLIYRDRRYFLSEAIIICPRIRSSTPIVIFRIQPKFRRLGIDVIIFKVLQVAEPLLLPADKIRREVFLFVQNILRIFNGMRVLLNLKVSGILSVAVFRKIFCL